MISFAQRYAELPAILHRPVALHPVTAPRLVHANAPVARLLGLPPDWLNSSDTLDALAGNAALPGATPLAMAYSGHQFGGWSPLLGDGRALLAGEITAPDGQRYDIHLKGSGPTPFSRRGDGRATLDACLRELIVSEAMAGLGIPTTRTLAVLATGERVQRRRGEPGAVMTHIAKSHVRVGTAQWLASQQDTEALRALLDHEATRNFPEHTTWANPALGLLAIVAVRQATLIAQWMAVGFIHGVMNTDNMQLAGETIDFGPCAFMDRFHPKKTFSSIDEHGRYAWDQQPGIAQWNLTRLAEAILPLIDADQDKAIAEATTVLQAFMPQFEQAFETAMRRKFGFTSAMDSDGAWIATMLGHLMKGEVDWTLFFRTLTRHAAGMAPAAAVEALFSDPSIARQCLAAWAERGTQETTTPTERADLMKAANPVFIARNHQVEAALRAAENGNLSHLHDLLTVLANPFSEQPDFAHLEAPPAANEEVRETFCNT
jgi:serine/tyrosine/threonine adenylyltransferase